MRGMRTKGFKNDRPTKSTSKTNGLVLQNAAYASRPDTTVTLKEGYVHVLTKKNKGTVVGVYTNKERANKDREELGGERYFRISNYFIDTMIYK